MLDGELPDSIVAATWRQIVKDAERWMAANSDGSEQPFDDLSARGRNTHVFDRARDL